MEGPTVTTERKVIFCYLCNQFRNQCPPGKVEGTCAKTEEEAALYRSEKDGNLPGFNISRLKMENDIGKTQMEMHHETIEDYKARGIEDRLGMKR